MIRPSLHSSEIPLDRVVLKAISYLGYSFGTALISLNIERSNPNLEASLRCYERLFGWIRAQRSSSRTR